jgi:hypothetical protein
MKTWDLIFEKKILDFNEKNNNDIKLFFYFEFFYQEKEILRKKMKVLRFLNFLIWFIFIFET